jgi:hypothetical protein
MGRDANETESTSGGARPVNLLLHRDRYCRARLLQLGLLLSACHLDRRPDLCRKNKLAQTTASWLSRGSPQRQVMPLAARSVGHRGQLAGWPRWPAISALFST